MSTTMPLFRFFLSLPLLRGLFIAVLLLLSAIDGRKLDEQESLFPSDGLSGDLVIPMPEAIDGDVEESKNPKTTETNETLSKLRRLEKILERRFLLPFEQTEAELLDIGLDPLSSISVRGKALEELANAYEDVLPSFGQPWAETWLEPDENDISTRLLRKYNIRADVDAMNEGGFEKAAQLAENVDLYGFLKTSVVNSHLNRTRALELHQLAAEMGNPDAQFRMGVLFANGALGVQRDIRKAVLYYYFSALSGHIGASIALGYRHAFGLGVPEDCDTAVMYYLIAVEKTTRMIEETSIDYDIIERERFSESGKQRGFSRRTSRDEDEEFVDYYKHTAEKGTVMALTILGQLYYHGLRGLPRDIYRAAALFASAAEKDEKTAQAYLGSMLIKGLGVPRNYAHAFSNLSASLSDGIATSPAAANSLGYMYLLGLHVEKDIEIAIRLFTEAADHGNANAHYNLGAIYISDVDVYRRDYSKALHHFTAAALRGHTLAMYRIALMSYHGITGERDCPHALELLKIVAERSEYTRLLSRASSFWINDGQATSSLQIYLIASELGFETAQANSAWLIDRGADFRGGAGALDRKIPSKEFLKHSDEVGSEPKGSVLAEGGAVLKSWLLWLSGSDGNADPFAFIPTSLDSLRLYELAAQQGNAEARLHVGDFFYYGLKSDGKQTYSVPPNFELAAFHYKEASDMNSPQAKFNLGYMHQHGFGMERDMHIAKRYYDDAAVAHFEARVPVYLALAGMYCHRLYLAVMCLEFDSDTPTLLRWAALGLHRHFGFMFSEKRSTIESDSSSQPVKESEGTAYPYLIGSIRRWDAILDAWISEMDYSTLIAVVIFMFSVLFVLLRVRISYRRYEFPNAHEHQD